MMKKGIVFEGDLKRTETIYRYISLSQFMAFVEKRQIILSKVINWEDTWEAPTKSIPVENKSGTLDSPSYCFEKNWYGQCWSRNGNSDALWRIYSSNREGILIQTTVNKFELINGIKFGILAPVIYYDNLEEKLREIGEFYNCYNYLISGFLKRKSFEHEQEVRLITINDEKGVGNRCEGASHIKCDLDPFEFIEGIIIDPRASDLYVSTIKDYCNRVGFDVVPQKSELYSENIFQKTQLIKKFVPVENS